MEYISKFIYTLNCGCILCLFNALMYCHPGQLITLYQIAYVIQLLLVCGTKECIILSDSFLTLLSKSMQLHYNVSTNSSSCPGYTKGCHNCKLIGCYFFSITEIEIKLIAHNAVFNAISMVFLSIPLIHYIL